VKIPEIIKQAARDLRNNMTPSEVILWNYLKTDALWVRFLRQKPIYVYTEDNGHDRFIIADFYSWDKKIVIELDGGIHDVPEVLLLDIHKEQLLEQKWIQTVRFTNDEIQYKFSSVIQKLAKITQN